MTMLLNYPGTKSIHDLAACWEFHPSEPLADSSYNGHDLTDTATVAASVNLHNGFYRTFDGATSLLSAADYADFDFSGGVFSIDGWFNVDTVAAECTIYQQFVAATPTEDTYNIRVVGRQLSQIVRISNTNRSILVSDAGAISINTWYHFAVTENGDTWNMYLNGAKQATSPVTSTYRCANYDSGVILGTSDGGIGARWFDGMIGPLRVWRKELSASEIGQLYNWGK